MRRIVNITQKRPRRPGAGVYLVTTPAGEPIAGNIVSLPPDILTRPGLVERAYQPPGDTGGKHRALARNFVLAGGYHLLVGHDLAEGQNLCHSRVKSLLTPRLWLAGIGTPGRTWAARPSLNPVDGIHPNAQ